MLIQVAFTYGIFIAILTLYNTIAQSKTQVKLESSIMISEKSRSSINDKSLLKSIESVSYEAE